MTITANAVVLEVRKLAKENPEFNYKQQPDLLSSQYIGGCSYLAGMTEDSYEYFQSQGKLPDDVAYEEARQRGLIGQRCIVGQALSNLGVSDKFLKTMEGSGADILVWELTLREKEFPKPVEELWLTYVQKMQDGEKSWSEAVAKGDEVYPIG